MENYDFAKGLEDGLELASQLEKIKYRMEFGTDKSVDFPPEIDYGKLRKIALTLDDVSSYMKGLVEGDDHPDIYGVKDYMNGQVKI